MVVNRPMVFRKSLSRFSSLFSILLAFGSFITLFSDFRSAEAGTVIISSMDDQAVSFHFPDRSWPEDRDEGVVLVKILTATNQTSMGASLEAIRARFARARVLAEPSEADAVLLEVYPALEFLMRMSAHDSLDLSDARAVRLLAPLKKLLSRVQVSVIHLGSEPFVIENVPIYYGLVFLLATAPDDPLAREPGHWMRLASCLQNLLQVLISDLSLVERDHFLSFPELKGELLEKLNESSSIREGGSVVLRSVAGLGMVEALKFFLKTSAKDLAFEATQNPLLIAILNHHPQTAQILAQEPWIRGRGQFGYSPLHYACEEADLEMCRVIYEADPGQASIRSADDNTPLVTALQSKNWDVVHYLAGCNLELLCGDVSVAKTGSGEICKTTVFHHLVRSAPLSLVADLFQENSALYRAKDDRKKSLLWKKDPMGYLPLHYAIAGLSPEVPHLLLSLAPETRLEKMQDGFNFFHAVGGAGDLPLFKAGLRYGSDGLKTRGKGQLSVLDQAIFGNEPEIVRLVLAHVPGQMKEAVPGRFSPFERVLATDDSVILQEFLSAGIDVNDLLIPKVEGNVPLHLAVHYGSVKCIPLLLGAGARVDLLNRARKRPEDLAKSPEVKKLFTDHRAKLRAQEIEATHQKQLAKIRAAQALIQAKEAGAQKLVKSGGGASSVDLSRMLGVGGGCASGEAVRARAVSSGSVEGLFSDSGGGAAVPSRTQTPVQASLQALPQAPSRASTPPHVDSMEVAQALIEAGEDPTADLMNLSLLKVWSRLDWEDRRRVYWLLYPQLKPELDLWESEIASVARFQIAVRELFKYKEIFRSLELDGLEGIRGDLRTAIDRLGEFRVGIYILASKHRHFLTLQPLLRELLSGMGEGAESVDSEVALVGGPSASAEASACGAHGGGAAPALAFEATEEWRRYQQELTEALQDKSFREFFSILLLPNKREAQRYFKSFEDFEKALWKEVSKLATRFELRIGSSGGFRLKDTFAGALGTFCRSVGSHAAHGAAADSYAVDWGMLEDLRKFFTDAGFSLEMVSLVEIEGRASPSGGGRP